MSPCTTHQVLALLLDPTNFNESKYPDDAKEHAKAILDNCGGQSIGAYSDPVGIDIIRQHVAEYIANRDDGIPACWQNIYLSAGASQSIASVLKLLNQQIDGKVAGVMVPVPEYPIFAASIDEYGMHHIGYYLNEDANWAVDISELERAFDEAKKHCNPRAIVVINPGNPTGQVLTRANIQSIIEFAHKHELFILADEVYQNNVYADESTFHSFKKVLFEMGAPYDRMELASFMSSSKGFMGRHTHTRTLQLPTNSKQLVKYLNSFISR